MSGATKTDGGKPPQPHAIGTAASHEKEAADHASFSVLFENGSDRKLGDQQPAYFSDLNIDQIIDGIVAGRDEYELRAFFNTTLRRPEAIRYRNQVFADCRIPVLASALRAFADKMRGVRQHRAQMAKLGEKLQKQAWLVDAIDLYCAACRQLLNALQAGEPRSRAFQVLAEYLSDYAKSPSFEAMQREAAAIRNELAVLRYKVSIEGTTFTVQRYEGEIDYSADVLQTFARFKQGDVKDHRSGKFHEWPDMNHVEAKILEFVSLLFPEPFARLAAFCGEHVTFEDAVIVRFDREIQFYAGYLEYIRVLGDMPFCEAEVSPAGKEVNADDGFDLALAIKLAKDGKPTISNSFRMTGEERVLVVSGPNQGGKTTFARMFGQMHYLAAIGCPVPGRSVHLHLFDTIFTHFEREESIDTLSGKLQDDLNRIHDILACASSDSIVILNEIFTSTSLADALFLSKRIMARIIERDILAVWVTFVDELSRLGPATVSMVSDVDASDPTRRTFKIQRKAADGRSHAMSLAQKHGLTYERVVERVSA
jgi:DNA mismatch repair protein MutS